MSRREIAAIHVPGFYPADLATQAAKKLLGHPDTGTYHKELTSSVGRIHLPFVDTRHDPEIFKTYQDHAIAAIQDLRGYFSPYASPADLIRVLLDEYWPGGAQLLRIGGRECFVGAIRVFEPKTSRFFAHNDFIAQESKAPEVANVHEQLVANMYLQVPEVGGELLLWLRDPTAEEQDVIFDVEGLRPDTVEPPLVTLRPAAGDLIIFSSKSLHAVNSVEGTHRVGMAAFIGVAGEDEPLRFWS